ncbi:hypothetical protein V8F06_002780 [Rhypophila decipiens]
MAPLNGAAGKPAKTAARRTASKPVVPVLPLNYPQRYPAAAKPAVSPSVSSPATPAHPNGQPPQDNNTLRDTHQQDGASAELRREGGQGSDKNNDYVMSSTGPPAMASSSTPGAATRASAEKVTGTPTAAVPNHALASPTPTRPPAHLHAASHHHRTSDLSVHNHSGPSFPPGMGNRPNFHQPHASNGSLVFGQFQDSNGSSPAPHPGVGFPAPPPGIMPFPQATRPVPAVDGYGRPLVVSPIINGYAPSTVSHTVSQPGPPTPHSFHGSQSSVTPDEAIFHSGHSPNGLNGVPTERTGHLHFSAGHASAADMHMNNGLHLAVHPGYHNLREPDDLLDFLRRGAVASDTFNDCVVEAYFKHSPQHFDHPEYQRMQLLFRAPAHRFILSRSPALAHSMQSMGTPANGVLQLDIGNEYIRPDVFSYVFRTLYGWSFGDGSMPFPSDLPPRDIRDDMQTTLSYIATACYLQLGAAYSVSIMRAARLLCWETIESLVAFVVPLAVISGKNSDFSASELLEDAIAFIVNQFPRDFVLDVNAVDSGLTRLPATEPPRNPNAPPIAYSTPAGSHSRQSSTAQAQMSHFHRPANARLSHIRFGDMTLEDRNGDSTPASPADTVRSNRSPTSNEAILSRILLNLPFELLKRVLEHPHLTNRAVGDNNATLHNLINEIVAEREARRLATLKPSNTQLEGFHQALENAARPLFVERIRDYLVNNMGFKEEVFAGDGPYLGRTWTGGASGSTSSN